MPGSGFANKGDAISTVRPGRLVSATFRMRKLLAPSSVGNFVPTPLAERMRVGTNYSPAVAASPLSSASSNTMAPW